MSPSVIMPIGLLSFTTTAAPKRFLEITSIIVFFLVLFSTSASANMLTGEMIRAEIVHALKKQNLTSNPAIDSSRQFPKCPSSIQVESLFGSWKTVEISCPDTSWKLAIRTNTTDVFLGTQGQNFE